MNQQEEINQLRKKIEQLKNSIKNCNHDFSNPIYDPEEEMIQDDRLGYEQHGVDRWPIPSFHKKEIPRWSRECKICGHKDYTYKTAPIVSSYEPDFKK